MKKDKIKLIEELLSKAVIELTEEDYLNLIESNENLIIYDEILGKNDGEMISDIYLKQLNDFMLDDIIAYLKKELS